MSTLTYSGSITIANCWCGIRHGVPSELYREAEENGHAVYCPLGHEWVVRETEANRLRRELKEANRRRQAERDLRRAEERSHAATRGHLTRQKRRAAGGTCPCCKRTFKQLAAHMKTKHPDYGA